MKERNELTTLCGYVAGLRWQDIPAEVAGYAKVLLADHLVSAVAGYVYNDGFNRELLRILLAESAPGGSSVLFQENRLCASGAAFMNAAYCHGADIDDGHRASEAHPGVAVIASLLALAEERGASGKDVLTAIVAGYETFIRVARAVLPSHLERGFHTTGTVGAIAAAAACARLLGLDGAGVERAVSLAATQAAGLLIVCESGQMCKPINPGRAAQAGLLSARLAMTDIEPPRRVFDSSKGFAHAFSDTYDPGALTDGLGERFFILDVYVKLYPSCRHTHATIEALKACIRAGGPLCDAERIRIITYPIAVDIVGRQRTPATTGDVKFSIPYTAACVAMYGDYGLQNLERFDAERPAVLDFIRRIEVVADPDWDDIPRGIRGAAVEIRDGRGGLRRAETPIARGEGEDRIGWDILREKAVACCRRALLETDIDALFDHCRAVDSMDRFSYYYASPQCGADLKG